MTLRCCRPLSTACLAFGLAVLLLAPSAVFSLDPDLRLTRGDGLDLDVEILPDPSNPFPATFNLYRGNLSEVSLYQHRGDQGGQCGLNGFQRNITLDDALSEPGSFYYVIAGADNCGFETSVGENSDLDDRPNPNSCLGPPGEPVDILGNGTHDISNLVLEEIGTVADGLNVPRDLEFHPDKPGELWVVNRADHSAVIYFDAGTPSQTSVKKPGLNNGVHFLAQPSALAFGPGTIYFATAHEEDDYTQGPPSQGGTPADFMGPTLWTNDSDIFQGGHESHFDMLHNSPSAVGIAFERETEYWVYDGAHRSLTHYDFNDDHGLGGTDHRDGVVTRYGAGEFGYFPDVVSHVVYDFETDLVIAADTFANAIKTLDPATGTNTGPTQPNYDGSTQTAVAGAVVETLIDGTCHDMVAPSGMELHDDLLFISDYSTSRIYAFTRGGRLADYLDTGLPSGTLMGMAFDSRDGSLYLVDVPGNRILRISVP